MFQIVSASKDGKGEPKVLAAEIEDEAQALACAKTLATFCAVAVTKDSPRGGVLVALFDKAASGSAAKVDARPDKCKAKAARRAAKESDKDHGGQALTKALNHLLPPKDDFPANMSDALGEAGDKMRETA